MFQRLLDAALGRVVVRGQLTVQYPDGTSARHGQLPGPEAGLRIRDPDATRRLLLNPALAFGELYMEGRIEPEGCGIGELVELLVLNQWQGGLHPAEAALRRLRQARRRLDQFNPAPRARRNVAHHYDLNGRLYALFLDRDRQYSCGYFPTGQETLEEAQALK
jgi:cyclopropane-fatty-acyl-phospholipid synthase